MLDYILISIAVDWVNKKIAYIFSIDLNTSTDLEGKPLVCYIYNHNYSHDKYLSSMLTYDGDKSMNPDNRLLMLILWFVIITLFSFTYLGTSCEHTSLNIVLATSGQHARDKRIAIVELKNIFKTREPFIIYLPSYEEKNING